MKSEELFKQLHEAINKNNTIQIDELVNEFHSGVVLEELSPDRVNVISWIDDKYLKGKKILEINGGCGITTRYLAERAEKVVSISVSDEQMYISRLVTKSYSNVEYIKSDFEKIIDVVKEKYDVIFVFNLADDNPSQDWKAFYDGLLDGVSNCLLPSGRAYFTFENKYGLKYWNGAGAEGGFFSSLSESKNHYLSKKDIKCMFDRVFGGKFSIRFLYPFPNEKYARILYSDERLPNKDELLKFYFDNFKYEDLNLFDEGRVWNNLVQENMFPFFSNAFVIELSNDSIDERRVIYSKFSNDRSEDYRIRTDIIKVGNDKKIVSKCALSENAEKHIRGIKEVEEKLKARFSDIDLCISDCDLNGDKVDSQFVNGCTLLTKMEQAVVNRDLETIRGYIKRYIEILRYGSEKKIFHPSEEFVRTFGNYSFSRDQYVSTVTDIDLNFDNILIDEQWSVIDYEWTFEYEIPQKYVLYRAMKYWRQASYDCMLLTWEEWMKELDITREEQEIFENMEQEFQEYVVGKTDGFQGLSKSLHNKIYSLHDILTGINLLLRVDVYYDYGFGFSPENRCSYNVDAFNGSTILLDISREVKKIRIDPGEKPCSIDMVVFDGNDNIISMNATNAYSFTNRRYVFDKEDPQIIYDVDEMTGRIKISIQEYESEKTVINSINLLNELDRVTAKNKQLDKKLQVQQKFRNDITDYISQKDGFDKKKDLALLRKKIDVMYCLDEARYDDESIYVRGWAFIHHFKYNDRLKYKLILQSEGDPTVYEGIYLDNMLRSDVQNINRREKGIELCGFEGYNFVDKSIIEGKVQIGIRIEIDGIVLKEQWFESYISL